MFISNLIFYNILEACRHSYDNGRKGVCHLVYASSSSVYGANEKVPYSTEDKVDNPVSLYAATKKANELIAHAYSKLYNIPSTGLRFFTVYGPAGRPDMAYYSFAENIIKNVPIKVFNNEDMYRDFTYIDDIVEGIFLVMRKTPILNDEGIRYKIYNIGKGKPEKLSFLIKCLEEELGKTAIKEYYPMQPGDMYQTYADISGLINDFDYLPMVELRDGIHLFVKWFLEKEYSI